MNNINDLIKQIYDYNPIVLILLTIISYFLLSIIALIVVIIVKRAIKLNKEKRANELRDKYQNLMIEFLYYDTNESRVVILSELKNDFNRSVFLEEILKFHANMSGDAAERIKSLYYDLYFHIDSLNKLKQKQWHIKIKGFRELAQMDVVDVEKNIEPFIKNKNILLQIEAAIALIKLKKVDNLDFLNELNIDLSDWAQINILNTLQFHKIEIKSFENMLKNPNETFVLFGVRMIGIYKELAQIDNILSLLSHPNERIRIACVDTLQKLGATETHPVLLSIYPHEIISVRKKILEAVAVLAPESMDDYFIQIILNDPFELKLTAAKILANQDYNWSYFKDAIENYSEKDKMYAIINHVTDSRI